MLIYKCNKKEEENNVNKTKSIISRMDLLNIEKQNKSFKQIFGFHIILRSL